MPNPPPPPTPAPGGASLERQCLEALKSIGKALGQMALYKVGHPSVAAMIDSALKSLSVALALTEKGELIVGVDHQQVIANGKIVGMTSQVPNSILNLFNRFKLSSLSFREGLVHAELAALCELAAARTGVIADAKAFLEQKGVLRIVLNEAIYLKAESEDAVVEEPAAEEPAAEEGELDIDEQIGEIGAAISAGSLEKTLVALVEKSVPDPALQKKVIARVMKLLEQDIERRVEEVIQPLKREKKAVENEVVRTASVIHNMVEGVVVVDERGKILMMNPAAEQIYGETLAQAAGKTITGKSSDQFVVTLAAEIVTPDDRDIGSDVKTQGAADTKRTLRASGAVVKTEGGQVVGMVTALPDVTKHKELQKIQRDFIAHVTHELRAPLSSIRAALDILDSDYRQKMGEEEGRMLTAAIKNSDRLADMVNSILDFSKIESGQMMVHPSSSEPGKIAKEAVDSLQPWAQKKQVTLSLQPPGRLPLVEADAPRTVQVLVNLLSNSIKFTPANGRIDVKLASRAEGGMPFVEFCVSDTGPGIPKAEHEHIFEKFAQIASGATHVGGTGLGLSIAKALVHLQKGRLWVESEPGQGARFYFTLPVYDERTAGILARSKQAVHKTGRWWKKLLGLK